MKKYSAECIERQNNAAIIFNVITCSAIQCDQWVDVSSHMQSQLLSRLIHIAFLN